MPSSNIQSKHPDYSIEVFTDDLQKAEDLCFDFGCDYEYSCVRDNKTGEIVYEMGNIMGLVEEA